jgi:hypothetical protein
LVEAIEYEFEQNDIEIIVIGTKGSTGSYEVIYGSNPTKIMDEVQSCPILAFPSKHLSKTSTKHLLESYLEEVQLSFHSMAQVSIPIGIFYFIKSRCSSMIAFVNKKNSFLRNCFLIP